MDPTFPDLFKLFGLTPLDDHILDKSGPRRIGGTTWMTVAALHHLSNKKDVCIIGRSQMHAAEIAQQVIDWGRKLSLRDRQRGADFAKFNNGTTLKWKVGTPDTVGVIGFRGVILNDFLWAERLERRTEGPYAMIRKIVNDGANYIGYAEDDEEVMVFTKAGAFDFINSNPDIRTEGWQVNPSGMFGKTG